MKISELIEQLETHKTVHGDLDVALCDSEGDTFPVSDVSTDWLNGEPAILVG